MVRFNTEGPAGLSDHKAPGKTCLLNAEHRAAFVRAVETMPKRCLDGVLHGRLIDLAQWLWALFDHLTHHCDIVETGNESWRFWNRA